MTTIANFASAVVRIISAAHIGVGPIVADAWMAVFGRIDVGGQRTIYGFIILVKPQTTLAAYTLLMAEKEGGLVESVLKSAPLLRELVNTIANEGSCWSGAVLDPYNVGLYTDEESEPVHAVVVDWSSCVLGRVPAQRIMKPFLSAYKDFLDEAAKSNVERLQSLFYESLKHLST
ncbi:MAG: hypothetical protein P4L69_07215 [Desulfosporosinus sp.]|nr:hypothetical protein [Desulfosporosinus sp.]